MTPAELRSLADKAAPGPWIAIIDGLSVERGTIITQDEDVVAEAFGHDARLLALAPDLARLCAEAIEQLQIENEKHPNHNITKIVAKLAELEAA